MSVRNIRLTHPVAARAATSLVMVDVLVVATYFFPSFTNYNLAIGAAMAIVLLGLSFLTGASGQISFGNAAFMGVGALAVAIWANHHPTTPIVAVLLIAVVCGALVGLALRAAGDASSRSLPRGHDLGVRGGLHRDRQLLYVLDGR